MSARGFIIYGFIAKKVNPNLYTASISFGFIPYDATKRQSGKLPYLFRAFELKQKKEPGVCLAPDPACNEGPKKMPRVFGMWDLNSTQPYFFDHNDGNRLI